MAKTQTKKLTPTQARIKATAILRGIDNNNAVIAKKLSENVQSARLVKTLISSATAVPATGAAPSPAKPAKASSKTAAKKPAKAAKKPQTKASAKAPQTQSKAASKAKAPVKDRPPLKDVIRSIIAKNGGKPMGAAEIYRAAVDKYGYWSRQSLYNALKDTRAFSKVGEEYKPVAAAAPQPAPVQTHAEEEADRFVQSVQGNQATGTVA